MNLSAQQRIDIVEAVRTASRDCILPRFRSLAPSEVSSKTTADDLVTAADLAAEAAISDSIRKILPGALIVGEEGVAKAPEVLSRLTDADTAVIIDPVDGTWNFAHGLSTFGVILSVTRRGKIVFGLHYDPINDDWIEAERGSGTWLKPKHERRLQLPSQPLRPASELFGLIPVWLFPEHLRQAICTAQFAFGRVSSLRCSCHEYRLFAQGSVDFLLSANAKPWDHAAGVLIATEAGGVARMLDGSEYVPGYTFGPLLVARDARTADLVTQMLFPILCHDVLTGGFME